MNWTINKKLIIGFLVMSLLIGVAGGLGLLNVTKIRKASDTISHEEIPVFDAVSKMYSLLLINKNLIEVYKGATTAIPVYNEEILPELEEDFQSNIKAFNLYSNAILNGSTIEGHTILPTRNPELRKYISEATVQNLSRFQVTANEVMERGKEMLTQKDLVIYSRGRMDSLYVYIRGLLSELNEHIIKEVQFADYFKGLKEATATFTEARFDLEKIGQHVIVNKIAGFKKSFEDNVSIFDSWLSGILDEEGEIANKELREIIKRLGQYFLEFKQVSFDVITAHQELIKIKNRSDDAIKKLDKAKEEMHFILMKAINETEKGINHAQTTADRVEITAQFILVLTAGIGTILGIIFGVLFSRQVIRKLKQFVKATKIISSGDMEHKVTVSSKDEVGILANSFNMMIENLRNTTVSKDYLDNIIKNMIDTLVVVRLDGKIETVNQATLDLLGYTEDEIVNRPITMIFKEEEENKELLSFKRSWIPDLINRGFVTNIEKTYLSKDGKEIPVLFSGSVIRNAEGSVQKIICVALDITERKRAEEQQMRLVTAIESAGEAIVITNTKGNIEYVNPNFENVTGYRNNEVIGRNMRMFKSGKHDQLFYQDMWNTITNDKVWTGRVINKKKDDTLFTERLTISPVHDSLGNIVNYVAIKRDITREIELEMQLRQAQKLEAIGTLVGGISHDFNNMLTPIIGYSDLMKAFLSPPKDKKALEMLEHIIKASNRSKDLIEQLLAFSRKGEQDRKALQIASIAKEVLKLMRASLPTTIDIRQNIESVCGIIMADPTQIHQVIVNLCTNAGHAMREKGGVLEISLSETEIDDNFTGKMGVKKGPFVKLTVSDTGCGMTPEVIERIFDPFFTTKKKGEGTGMGLATVHGIVKSHGGAITVSSEIGKGTIFTVFFPKIESEAIVPSTIDEQPIPKGNECILFIDDEEDIVNLGKEMLGSLGYEVVAERNSIKAMEIFRAQPGRFDLIITDQTMPKMTGYELAREILRIRPEVPIILCSGFSHTMNAKKAKAIGISEYLMKPYNPKKIAVIIRRLLNENSKFS